ncbi:hypothetical protein ASE01_04850 [Nocardioides sp. Root190]|uniref:DUF4097 family beta strand repeat-containing protein n=1 Tax=Nocardioides sp. Root190 TaxID=1736488 RepID=UPI0006F324F1|nr:DUF4097 family beta strand repeat-containing protein [Nocardioides sp. Root190]KRB78587.1 hypothetical protein ASE01_04850 [Nocardioides sp. Root190]
MNHETDPDSTGRTTIIDPQGRSFATPAPVHLYVENGSGRIAVTATAPATAGATTTVRVSGARAEEVTVVQDGERISVIAPKWRTGFFGGNQSLDIEVEVPDGSHLVLKSGSADVDVVGQVATVRVKCGSAGVRVERVGDSAVIDTGSGDVALGAVAGDLRIRSGSGAVSVQSSSGAASISTGSGSVRIGYAARPVVVKTGSGDLEILESEDDVASTSGSGSVAVRRARRGRISAKGASGNVIVGVPAGIAVWTDISTVTGRVSSTLPSVGQPEPGADHVELRVTTVSGDIALAPA